VLDLDVLNISRERLYEALVAEGVEGLTCGYINVHLLPMFQKKIAFGSNGFPWSSDICRRDVDYNKGICPVAEKLHSETFLGYEMCLNDLNYEDIDLIVSVFKKVWDNLKVLR
jgi:hypothetical protein